MFVDSFDFEKYNKTILPIDEEYINIVDALEDRGYFYYNTLSSKKQHFHRHIFKRKDKYYIIYKVTNKNKFINYVELAEITEYIKEIRGWN